MRQFHRAHQPWISMLSLGAIIGLTLLLAGYLRPQQQESMLAPRALPLSGPVAGAPGRLLYIDGDTFVTLAPGTKAVQELAALPANSNPDAPVVSPDGTHIAYTAFPPATVGGNDLFVMDADGTNQRLVLAHAEDQEYLDGPAWAPDGQSLYVTRYGRDEPPRIERVRLDGTERTMIVTDAHSPSVAPDGRLVYVARDPGNGPDTVWIMDASGGNARPLLPDAGFQAVASPLFAPGGERIAFVGVGGPGRQLGAGPGRAADEWLAWLGPRVASAHGTPWDLWVMQADGTGLQRVTDIREDGPIPAWSPDGRWLGLKGEVGVYVLNPASQEIWRLAEGGAPTGLAWLGP